MVESICDQMRKRGFEPVEDIAVDERRLPLDLQLDRFSEFPRGIAHQSCQAGDPLMKGPQSSSEHGAIQALRGELIGARELVEIGNLRGQDCDLPLQFSANRRPGLRRFHVVFKRLQRLGDGAVIAVEQIAPSGDLPRGNQHFSRERKQTVKPIGGRLMVSEPPTRATSRPGPIMPAAEKAAVMLVEQASTTE